MSVSESRKPPKTGLAGRMREWMKSRNGRVFAPVNMADALRIPTGRERKGLHTALGEFVLRGEVLRLGLGQYRYNPQHGQTPRVAELEGKVLKAAYLAGRAFTIADIRRLTEAGHRNYIARIMKRLVTGGYIAETGGRNRRVYRVVDRERYRVEVLP